MRKGWPALPVRWIVQQRGPKKWRYKLIGKEFVASGPHRRRLFTPASTMSTTRILDFLDCHNHPCSMTGDVENAYFQCPEEEAVCMAMVPELASRREALGLYCDVVLKL